MYHSKHSVPNPKIPPFNYLQTHSSSISTPLFASSSFKCNSQFTNPKKQSTTAASHTAQKKRKPPYPAPLCTNQARGPKTGRKSNFYDTKYPSKTGTARSPSSHHPCYATLRIFPSRNPSEGLLAVTVLRGGNEVLSVASTEREKN